MVGNCYLKIKSNPFIAVLAGVQSSYCYSTLGRTRQCDAFRKEEKHSLDWSVCDLIAYKLWWQRETSLAHTCHILLWVNSFVCMAMMTLGGYREIRKDNERNIEYNLGLEGDASWSVVQVWLTQECRRRLVLLWRTFQVVQFHRRSVAIAMYRDPVFLTSLTLFSTISAPCRLVILFMASQAGFGRDPTLGSFIHFYIM